MRVKISENCTDYEGVLAGKEGIIADLDWYSLYPKVRVDVGDIDYYISRNYIKSLTEDILENKAKIIINNEDRTKMFEDFMKTSAFNKENTKMVQVSEKIKTLIKAKFAKEQNELDKKQEQELYNCKLNSKAGKEFIKFKKSIDKFNDNDPLYEFSEDWLSDEDKKCLENIYKKYKNQMYNIHKQETELIALLEVTDTFDQKLKLLNAYNVTEVSLGF